ncbi:MAG: phospholipase D family protein [Alphaproteobacteria bacterium]|nr:phospholipase D family protein [Alphaproteobacteria bacterium]
MASSRIVAFFYCLLSFGLLLAPEPAVGASLSQCLIEALQGSKVEQAARPTSSEVAFSPNGDATTLVTKLIGSAKKTVRMAAYSLTSRPIAQALINAKEKGVDVRVLVDHGQIQSNSHSVVNRLQENHVTVRVDITHTLQHNKYIIVDEESLETGSFNYSAAAEYKNAENVLVLWQSPDLAARYIKNWETLWAKAEPYKEPYNKKLREEPLDP